MSLTDLKYAKGRIAELEAERDKLRLNFSALYAEACPDWAMDGVHKSMIDNAKRYREMTEAKLEKAEADLATVTTTPEEGCYHYNRTKVRRDAAMGVCKTLIDWGDSTGGFGIQDVVAFGKIVEKAREALHD